MILSPYQKPPLGAKLNFGHPLAKGLVGCWLFNEGSGDKVFDYSGQGYHGTIYDIAAQSATSGWNLGSHGMEMMFDGSNDRVSVSGLPIIGTNPFTLLISMNPRTLPAGNKVFWGHSLDQITILVNAANKIQFYSSGYRMEGSGVVEINTPYFVVIVGNSSSINMYQDLIQCGATWTTNYNLAPTSFNFGSHSSTGVEPFPGRISFAMRYNRALSANEIAYLYSNPYCMFDSLSYPSEQMLVRSGRGITSRTIVEVGKSQNQPFHLVDIVFDATPQYVTDAWKNIIWNGHTYTVLGHFIAFSDIEESAELQVASLTAQLSGVDQSVISAVLAEDYIDRPLRIYKGFLDANMAVIADPILIFEGRMDSPVIEENPDDGSCVVSVSATNAWVDFERLSGRHTNHEEQQIFFPGDKGFEFVSEITQEITWGRK